MLKADELLCVSVSHSEIDLIHRELAELVVKLAAADDENFAPLYSSLIEHTESHFTHEERLIADSGFPHGAEHISEHRQMLQEMKRFQQRIAPGRMPIVRAYVTQRLPERLNLHITRMDSLLASHLCPM